MVNNVNVNLGDQQSFQIETLDITGKNFVPTGLLIHLLDKGLIGFDKTQADSSLTSSKAFLRVVEYMNGKKCSPFEVLVLSKGRLIEEEVNFPAVLQVVVNNRLMGLLGRAVPPAQNAYTCAKLGKSAGFYLINHDDQGGGGGSECYDREISLSECFDQPEYDEDEYELSR